MKRKSNKNNGKTHKERFLGLFSGLSGSLSFLGGWQVCHNLCLGIIALLSIIGITVVGVPFMNLQSYQIAFWSIGGILIASSVWMFVKPKFQRNNRGVV